MQNAQHQPFSRDEIVLKDTRDTVTTLCSATLTATATYPLLTVTQGFLGVKICIISHNYYYLQLHLQNLSFDKGMTYNMPVNIRGFIVTMVLNRTSQLAAFPSRSQN